MLFALFLFAFIAAIVWAVIHKKRKQERLRAAYYLALQGTNKAEAVRLGRLYYGSLRPNGQPTIYDEQAITNDLQTMKA